MAQGRCLHRARSQSAPTPLAAAMAARPSNPDPAPACRRRRHGSPSTPALPGSGFQRPGGPPVQTVSAHRARRPNPGGRPVDAPDTRPPAAALRAPGMIRSVGRRFPSAKRHVAPAYAPTDCATGSPYRFSASRDQKRTPPPSHPSESAPHIAAPALAIATCSPHPGSAAETVDETPWRTRPPPSWRKSCWSLGTHPAIGPEALPSRTEPSGSA